MGTVCMDYITNAVILDFGIRISNVEQNAQLMKLDQEIPAHHYHLELIGILNLNLKQINRSLQM